MNRFANHDAPDRYTWSNATAGAVLPRMLATGLALLCLEVLAWFYAGFFVVAPELGRLAGCMLWGARVGIPLVVLVALWLVRAVRTGRTKPAALVLATCILALGALILWSVANHLHARRTDSDRSQFHPYLQLTPHDWQPRPVADGAAPLRIFCLGGSTTEFTDSNGQGWPDRVEQRLQASLARPVEVHNLGRQWYTSLHTLINYEVNLRPHKPDIIIVMHGVNDLLQNADFSTLSMGGFRPDYGHFLGPVTWLVKPETLAQRLRQDRRKIWRYAPPQVIESDTFPGLDTFRLCLGTLLELARADGTRVVLLTQPHLFKEQQAEEERAAMYMIRYEAIGGGRQWSVATALRGMNAYNNATRQLAAERHVDLIDMDLIVPKDMAHFSDEVHYRDQTFDLIAARIAAQLQDALSDP